jgi:hypothetical protein
MRDQKRLSPAASRLLFTIDPEPIDECVTALGGVSLLIQAVRSLGVAGSVKRNVVLKQRQRGLDEASYVESFVILNAVGGDCLEDFERLREDPGLAEMAGYEMPSSEAARKFLYQFHDPEKLELAQRGLPLGQVSYIPEESPPLQGLGQVNVEVVQELGRRCGDQKIATIDLDSTVIESWKREAKPTYEGGTGYQPMLALWAEMNVIVAEELRDGNVPAVQEPLRVAKRAYAALPETVQERYFRGDAGCYEEKLVSWLRDAEREQGPGGFIGFAISAMMSQPLREEILSLAEEQWQPYSEDGEVIKEWANADYCPEQKKKRDWEPLRYIALRIRQRQRELFSDGSAVKHFAVVTNLWDWDGRKLLEWHREKAGSIEAAHDVLKNELGAGVLPCGRFGANAAWLRLAVLSYNILTALKRLALPPELLQARPKRLRFLIFHTPGKLIHHARQMVLRLVRATARFSNWRRALELLPIPASG